MPSVGNKKASANTCSWAGASSKYHRTTWSFFNENLFFKSRETHVTMRSINHRTAERVEMENGWFAAAGCRRWVWISLERETGGDGYVRKMGMREKRWWEDGYYERWVWKWWEEVRCVSSMIRMMGKTIGEVSNRNGIRKNGFIRCIMRRI